MPSSTAAVPGPLRRAHATSTPDTGTRQHKAAERAHAGLPGDEVTGNERSRGHRCGGHLGHQTESTHQLTSARGWFIRRRRSGVSGGRCVRRPRVSADAAACAAAARQRRGRAGRPIAPTATASALARASVYYRAARACPVADQAGDRSGAEHRARCVDIVSTALLPRGGRCLPSDGVIGRLWLWFSCTGPF